MVLELMDKVIIGVVGFFVLALLLPELLGSLDGFDWSNVTVAGETKDYSIVPKVFILGIMVALIVYGVKQIPNLKRR